VKVAELEFLEADEQVEVGEYVERSMRVGSVLDYGRPSISGSIRSIKMYNWA
jgi:hypothetical protein